MKAALIYCRVSSARQAEKFSLPAQRRALEEHAARQGWQYETHEETGSGETIEARPVFRAILERIARGEAHTLLVIDFDRLSRARNLGDLETVKSICRAAGCKVATPGQSLDLGDADDDFLHTLFGALSTREKQKLLARQRRGIAEARAAGRWVGGTVPTGYRYDPVKRTIVPDPEVAPVMRELLKAAQHAGVRVLHAAYPSLGPIDIWRAITPRRLAIYSGRALMPDGSTVPAAWDPLIDGALAARVNAARERRKNRRTFNGPGVRLLTGLGIWRCGHCGGAISAKGYSKPRLDGSRSTYFAYRCCPHGVRPSAHSCPNKPLLKCSKVDAVVVRAIWDELPALLAAPEPAVDGKGQASPAAAALEAAMARRDRLVAAVEEGVIAPHEARDRLAAVRREVAELSRAVEDELLEEPAAVELPAGLSEMIASPPERIPHAAARELVRATCRRIELFDRQELRLTFVTGARTVCRVAV